MSRHPYNISAAGRRRLPRRTPSIGQRRLGIWNWCCFNLQRIRKADRLYLFIADRFRTSIHPMHLRNYPVFNAHIGYEARPAIYINPNLIGNNKFKWRMSFVKAPD